MTQPNSYSSLSDFLNTPSPSLAPFPEPSQTTDGSWGARTVARERPNVYQPPRPLMEQQVNNQSGAEWGPLYTPAEEERQRIQRQNELQAEQQRQQQQPAEQPHRQEREITTIAQRQPTPAQLPTGHVLVTTTFIHQHHEILKELAVYKAKLEESHQQRVKAERPPTVSLSGTSTEEMEDPPTPTPQPPHHPFQLRNEDCGASVTSVSSAATVRRYIGHIRGPGSIYHKYRVYKRLYFNTDVFRHKYYRLLADFSRRPRRCIDCHCRITKDCMPIGRRNTSQD